MFFFFQISYKNFDSTPSIDNICIFWTTQLKAKPIIIYKKKHNIAWTNLNYNKFCLLLPIQNFTSGSIRTGHTCLTLSPNMEDGFRCDKGTRTEEPHSYLCWAQFWPITVSVCSGFNRVGSRGRPPFSLFQPTFGSFYHLTWHMTWHSQSCLSTKL